MNKKGDLSLMMKILFLFIVFAVMLFVYSDLNAKTMKVIPENPEGGATKNIADIKAGDESSSIYSSLVSAFERAAKSSDTKCYVKVDDFPEFKDDKVIVSNINSETWMRIDDKDGRIAKESADNPNLAKILPCIVAGQYAQQFADNVFKNANNVPDYFELAKDKKIIITEKDKINFDGTEYSTEDNDCCGSQLSNILYKSDANHLCFIATYKEASNIGGPIGWVASGWNWLGERFTGKTNACPVSDGKVGSDCIAKVTETLKACV